MGVVFNVCYYGMVIFATLHGFLCIKNLTKFLKLFGLFLLS